MDVAIQNFAFSPSPITVYQGTTIRWTNMDAATHTSTSDTAIWDSGNLTTGQTYSRRFDTVGTFAYHCEVHPNMTASVVVLTGCPPVNTPTTTATRTATQTNTPQPTSTNPAGVTNTPTRQPTACTIHFTDVLPTDFFYEGVTWLYCHGAISGYADNTFRPYANTTRGQMVKIVVLAVGIPNYAPATPTFKDVPTTQPFYRYIETAAYNDVVSGYNCGGPGEPCPGVYFRPNNLVTRGQLSKIIVVAVGWSLINPPTATFSDTPRNSTFYTYIETAYCHQVLSGYDCGGAGEPCPGKYFRAANNATRGQISKMVYNAVSNLPSCPAASTSTPTNTPAPRQVNIQGSLFAPTGLSIPAGTSVRWTNLDDIGHTTTSDGVWDSAMLAQNASFTFTFNTPGTYLYYCEPHPWMTGTITVTAR